MKNHRLFLSLFRTLTLVLLLISGSLIETQAQQVEPVSYRKTTLHGGLGFAGIYGTAFLNLERMLTQSLDKKVTGTFGKAGYGTYGSWGDSGQYLYLQYGFITGQNASHFEMSAGPNFTIQGDMELPIAFSVGYRHQKPGKPFLFRTGLAFPESLFFAMGLSF